MIARRDEEIAKAICDEAGKPIVLARGEVQRGVETFTGAAAETRRLDGEALAFDALPRGAGRFGIVRRFPVGPVAAISPFNFPLNLAVHKVAPGIPAGCPVILKPASQTPVTAMLLAECCIHAGLPDGALPVLPAGRADADRLVTNERIRLLSFTGSPSVGWDMKAGAMDSHPYRSFYIVGAIAIAAFMPGGCPLDGQPTESMVDGGGSSSTDGSTAAGSVDAGLVDASKPDAGPVDAGPVDAGPDDAGPDDAGPDDAGPDDAGPDDAGSPIPPTGRDPCDVGRCWLNAPALSGACGTATVNEDFSTGLYNVHRFPLAAPAGVSVESKLEVANGTWSPAVIVLATDGTTLYDGEHPLVGGAVEIVALASGRSGNRASARVTAAADTPLFVFVTSWTVIEDGFVPAMPSDGRYTLSVRADCPLPEATCPMHPDSISTFGSGYFTSSDSSTPDSPNYNPYKRDSRTQHSGYDLHAPRNTQVVATQSGMIVSTTTTDTGDCGRSINLAADTGVTFRYCHLESVTARTGRVEAGELIGLNGNSGNAINPHVHFVYLDAPNVTGSGTDAQRSAKVNAYVDPPHRKVSTFHGPNVSSEATCKSCNARARWETGGSHLVDHVLPDVPMRQWVVMFPHELGGALAILGGCSLRTNEWPGMRSRTSWRVTM